MPEHVLYELTDEDAEQIARTYVHEDDAAEQMHKLADIWSAWAIADPENNKLPFLLWLSVRLTAACRMAFEYSHIFELQRKRTLEADALWRAAHPENKLASPDLGKLLEWLMEQKEVPEGSRLSQVQQMARSMDAARNIPEGRYDK